MMKKTVWEFHDSVLAGVTQDGSDCVLHFAKAYLRVLEQNGGAPTATGWVQKALLRIGGVRKAEAVLADLDEDGVDIWRGEMVINDSLLNGVVELPLAVTGSVSATFTLITGEVIAFEGDSATVQLQGEPVFVEHTTA